MSQDALFARALLDQTTGLPNGLYFRLIQDWEARRARRRRQKICVLTVRFQGGDPRLRRSLTWQLRRELRENDLVAAEGQGTFRILLTSPDAECAAEVLARVLRLVDEVNADLRGIDPVTVRTAIEDVDGNE